MSMTKDPRPVRLYLFPQIVFADLEREIASASLDVQDFVRRAFPLVEYVPDVQDDESTRLIRALLEVPLPGAVPFDEWISVYREVGIREPWTDLVRRLRVCFRADSCVLAEAEATGTGQYLEEDDDPPIICNLQDPLQHGIEVIRPRSRTMAGAVDLTPGDYRMGAIPPASPQAPTSAELDGLVQTLLASIRKTIGGEAFLGTSPRERALSVLAATVAGILGHPACQRARGRTRVVRADMYRAIFDDMDLGEFFDVARAVLERGHPHAIAIEAPWPPGVDERNQSLAVLEWRSGYLALQRSARLKYLPVL